MIKTALVDYWTCDFGDGICHKWTIGKDYNIVEHVSNKLVSSFENEEIKDTEIQIITYDISSDKGISKGVPVEIINTDMMLETFNIKI